MANKLIQNGFVSGALAGIMAGRGQSGSSAVLPTPADFTAIANVVAAIVAECLVQNTALGVAAMADADNTEIGFLCLGAAMGGMYGVNVNSVTAADYIRIANQIVASAKQAVAKLQ